MNKHLGTNDIDGKRLTIYEINNKITPVNTFITELKQTTPHRSNKNIINDETKLLLEKR